MTGNVYALIRVSTEEQNEARQVIAMTSLGIRKENIIIEKESGKSTGRAKYKGLVKKLRCGDTLYIENLDRLSRDYDGMLEQWNILTKKKGVTIKILDTPMLDTDRPSSTLSDKFMRDMFLLIQAFQADAEWQKIKARQAQGIAAAKARGKRLGRPKSVITDREKEIVKQYRGHEIDLSIALELLSIKKSAFYNLCRVINEVTE
jgi:DNA invertase Pin-like site-specific DNA recombinase